MKQKYLKIVACVLFSLSVLIFGYYIYQELSTYFMVPTIFKLLYTFGSSIYAFFGSLILGKVYKSKKNKINYFLLIFLFIEYMFLLIVLTLFAPAYGRGTSNIFNLPKADILNYIKEYSNLIPFKTIINYIRYDNLKFILINIFGNLIAFMPLGLFLPLIFKKINSLLKFTISVTLIIIFIEIMQMVLLTGSMDIDDLILNLSGALMVYLLYRKRK